VILVREATVAQRKKNLGPAIFHFQPTEIEWIEAAALAQWEKAMAQRVGIVPARDEASPSPKKKAKVRRASPKSYFKCGGDDWDGCDAG